jgi:L-lactate dehydrogenase complex protein LldG
MTPVDERELLLRRVGTAAGKHRSEVGGAVLSENPREPLAEDVRLERFEKMFTSAAGVLFHGPPEAALSVLGEALRSEGVAALFFPEEDAQARQLATSLAPFGPFSLTSGAEVRGGSAAVTAGFRSAEAGIAETGTVVETSSGGRTFLPGLLADVHVSLLSASSIVDRLEDALAPLAAGPPRNISFLTGPSRSADIEQTLTLGAHGPRKVIVLLLA